MHMQRKTGLWVVVMLTGLLTACGSLLESGKPARQVYLLQTPTAPSPSSAPAENRAPTLIITVTAVPGMDSDLIQALGNDAQLSPVANAHWPDHLPEVLASITRHYLSDTGKFRSVRQGTIARPDQWLLEIEITAFHGTMNSNDSITGVVLELQGMLHCNDENHDLSIKQQANASGDSLSSLVAAHQQVLNAALHDLPDQIINACAENGHS